MIMNNPSNYRRTVFKLTNLIYLIHLILQFNNVLTNQLNQMNHQKIQQITKSPCAIKSNGCFNHQNNLSPPKDKHFLNNHLVSNSKISRSSSGYITDNHHYKLTPIDHLNRKIDLYHSRKHEDKNLKYEHFPNKEANLNRTIDLHQNVTEPMVEALYKPVFILPDSPSLNQSFYLNASSSLPLKRTNNFRLIEEIYGELSDTENTMSNDAKEKIEQINAWLASESSQIKEVRAQIPKQIASHGIATAKSHTKIDLKSDHIDKNVIDKNEETMKTSETKLQSDYVDYEDDKLDQQYLNKIIEKRPIASKQLASTTNTNYNVANNLSGTVKTPPCASPGRFYCSYKEDYPESIVAEITRYYKWPLEKLFRDLRQQVMPKLANDNYGALVCDSITRVVRPGWVRNTANKWLVVINTEEYQQYVTEILCRDANSRCNFIPPCYSAQCKQRFNTQKLLVIDPFNRFKGPFLSEFLFPSCCVCYIPEAQNGEYSIQSLASNLRATYTNAPKKLDEKSNIKIEF